MLRPVAEVIEEINSWDNIAHELAKRGITGTPECSDKCPLANFIIGETSPKEVSKISVDGAGVDVTNSDGESSFLPFGASPRNFITDFDEGEYPDLCDDPSYFDYLDEDPYDDYEDPFDEDDDGEDLSTVDPADVY